MPLKDLFQFKTMSMKLMVVMGTVMVFALVLLNMLVFSRLESTIMDDKRDMTRKLVQTKLSVLEHYHALAEQGQLTDQEAKSRAVKAVEHSFYGPGNKDYFWINDHEHVMVMHPYKPQLNGQNVSDVQDRKGNFLFQDMVNSVREKGSGYVSYHWQYYGQKDRIEPKLSYVAGFGPWEWIVGTGVYVNDVQERVAAARNNLLLMEGLLVAVILLVTVLAARFIAGPIRRLQASAAQIAQGDLDAEINISTRDEIGSLARAFEHMVGNLKAMISQAEEKTVEAKDKAELAEQATLEAEEARKGSEQSRMEGMQEAAHDLAGIVDRLSAASEEISAQIDEVSRNAEEQKSRTNEVATAIEEMNASVLEISRNASQAAEGSEETRIKAEEGNAVMAEVSSSMKAVHARAGEMTETLNELGRNVLGINQVMEVINDIADQTNLLALNAAIEAARAGEAGKGFAVVADEVRKLAEKTMQATREVGETIQAIQNKTSQSVEDMNQTNTVVQDTMRLASQAEGSLKKIVSVTESNSEQVRNIATASEQQSTACEEINQSTEDVNRTAAETSEAMSQSSQAVHELTRLTSDMSALIESMVQGSHETDGGKISHDLVPPASDNGSAPSGQDSGLAKAGLTRPGTGRSRGLHSEN